MVIPKESDPTSLSREAVLLGHRGIIGMAVPGPICVSYSLQHIARSLISADPRRSGKLGQPPSRDKFAPIVSPYMSLSLESWQKALGAVDRSP